MKYEIIVEPAGCKKGIKTLSPQKEAFKMGWQTFWGKRVLCGNDRASERRDNQKVYRRAGRVQQDRRIKSLF